MHRPAPSAAGSRSTRSPAAVCRRRDPPHERSIGRVPASIAIAPAARHRRRPDATSRRSHRPIDAAADPLVGLEPGRPAATSAVPGERRPSLMGASAPGAWPDRRDRVRPRRPARRPRPRPRQRVHRPGSMSLAVRRLGVGGGSWHAGEGTFGPVARIPDGEHCAASPSTPVAAAAASRTAVASADARARRAAPRSPRRPSTRDRQAAPLEQRAERDVERLELDLAQRVVERRDAGSRRAAMRAGAHWPATPSMTSRNSQKTCDAVGAEPHLQPALPDLAARPDVLAARSANRGT